MSLVKVWYMATTTKFLSSDLVRIAPDLLGINIRAKKYFFKETYRVSKRCGILHKIKKYKPFFVKNCTRKKLSMKKMLFGVFLRRKLLKNPKSL
jgi:hypothetical protein